jgi:hypothetical protein
VTSILLIRPRLTVRVKAAAILLLAKAKDPDLRGKAAAIRMMVEKVVKDTMHILPRVPKGTVTTIIILRTLEKAAAIPKTSKVKDTLVRVKAMSKPKSL